MTDKQRVPSRSSTVVTTPHGATPTDERHPDGQAKDHWVLPEAERAKGFVRPVRLNYIHEKCGSETYMPQAIAETWARNVHFYGRTFCVSCRSYESVNEFVWVDARGHKTDERLGA